MGLREKIGLGMALVGLAAAGRVGETIAIVYDPADPTGARPVPGVLGFFLPGLFLGVGGFLLLASVSVLRPGR